MSNHSEAFIRSMKNGLKFRLFLLMNLPAAFFSGLRIREMDRERCAVTVPFKWFTKNPFRSTYFACLAMAAEMSTGALAMAHLPKTTPRVSMLVTGLRANYFKKATGPVCFTCAQGLEMGAVIRKAIDTGEAQQFTAVSVGMNEQGEKTAEFYIEWGFKTKTS